MGLEYHFDKNDGLIAKIFAALGMMFTQGMKDQENSVDMAKAQAQAQAQEMNENRPETGGVKESNPNITSTTVKGLDKEDLNKVAQQNNAPIKDSATTTHENTLTF